MKTELTRNETNVQIESAVNTARTLLCTLLHNFQSNDSEVLPIQNVAELLALIDDKVKAIEDLTHGMRVKEQDRQQAGRKENVTRLDQVDALTAYATRTKAIATTMAGNFSKGSDAYRSIPDEAVASLLWQIEANMDVMRDLAVKMPQ